MDASSLTTVAKSWDAASGTCSNVLTGVTLRFVTGQAYSSANLQSKILYASVCYTYGTWKWENPTDIATVQRFPLTFKAEFIPKAASGVAGASKPQPPLFVPVSPDIWYPFVKSTTS